MSLEVGTSGLSIDELGARLAEAFGTDLGDLRVQEPDTLVARVPAKKLHGVAERLKSLPDIGYDSCNVIAAVDLLTRIETVYHLYSYASNSYLELHVDLDHEDPVVRTVCDVWPSANWHEREAWDMMGVRFEGHPDHRRILLKDDFIGHPLRKDYVDLIENHPHA